MKADGSGKVLGQKDCARYCSGRVSTFEPWDCGSFVSGPETPGVTIQILVIA